MRRLSLSWLLTRGLALWFLLTSLIDAVVLLFNLWGEIAGVPPPSEIDILLTVTQCLLRLVAGNALWYGQPAGWRIGAATTLVFAAVGLGREWYHVMPGVSLLASGTGLLYHGFTARWLNAGGVRREVFGRVEGRVRWLGIAADLLLVVGAAFLGASLQGRAGAVTAGLGALFLLLAGRVASRLFATR